MDQFNYRDGRLFCEDVAVEDIAAAAGTPVYIYSAATITDHYRKLVAAFKEVSPLICYSIKSCSNLSILKLLADLGAGMDVVSGGELFRAGLAKVPGSRIVYAGVGKTDDEIVEALDYNPEGSTRHGIRLFNIESEAEFENIASIARSRGVSCEATLRVNPDVDPKTHVYTTTGKKETKFGVDLERARAFFRKYGRNEHCRLTAIHLHIGSPVYTVEPYIEAVKRALALIDELVAAGHRITALNLGGGFGADYTSAQSPLAADYASAIVPLVREHVQRGLKIILEPGRSIIANAGILLSRVQYLKKSGQRHFVIIDGGMHTLIRPALYGSFHFIWPARVSRLHVPQKREQEMDLPGLELCDVVGPICESSDFLAKDRGLPPMVRGDLLAVFSAGAYGMVMASHYNSHPLPAEVLVVGERASVIRTRETYDDLVARERQAEPLLGPPLED
ncbi:MAG: diaminopimelate decarboxylase [Phycisphaerales bacterium]|nr:diaminopimelate decarboxylase [Phycisphaerales bacterium]